MTSRLMRFFRVVFTGTLVLAVLGTAVFVGVRMYLVKSVTADDIRAAAAQSIADGDPGTARLYYLKLIHLDPDDTDARMALVRLSLEPGADPEDADNYATNVEALAQFAEVAARRPKDQSINTLLMSALFKAGRIGDATDVAQCLVDAGHSGDLAFRLLAIRAIDAGELDQAQHWLTKLENQAGDNTMQHALLFLRYHSLRQDRDETRKFLRQILQTFAGGHESSLNELLVQDRDSFFKLIDAAQGFAGQQPPDEPLIDSTLLTLWRIGDAQDAPDRHMLMLQRIARLLLATRTFSSDAGFQERHQQRVARFVGWCKPIKNPPPVVAEQLARAAFTAGDSRRAFDILRSTAARMAVDAKSAELDVESAEQPANSMQSLLRSTPDEQSRFLLFASQHMLAAGRPVDAEALIEQLLKTDGSTGWAYLLRATIALGEDRLADAEHDLKAAEAVMSGDPLIHVPMAQLYLRQARWFDAQQTLELARIGWQSLNESHREWLERVFGGRSGIDLGQAAALLGMGELERARPWLESLKNGPYAVKCERLLIWYYTRQGDIETSRKHIRSARERFPHDVLLMVADATVLREEGQAEAAERVVRLFAEQHPQSLAASMLVAQFLIETNRRDAAIAWLDQTSQRFMNMPQAGVLAADLLMSQGKLDSAASTIADLQARHPQTESVLLVAARWALLKHGCGEQFDAVLADHPTLARSSLVQAWQGKWHAENGQPDDALQLLDQSMSSSRTRAKIRPDIAKALAVLADRETPAAALQRVEALIKTHGEDAFLMRIAATLAIRADDLDRAERSLKRVEFLADDSFDSVLLLARIQHSRGRIDEASAALERAAKQRPKSFDVHLLAAQCGLGRVEQLKVEQLETALDHAKQAIAIDPERPEPHVIGAAILRQQGKVSTALQWLGPVFKKWPKHLDAYVLLIDVYREGHDIARARAVLDTAKKWLPDERGLDEPEFQVLVSEQRWDDAGRIAVRMGAQPALARHLRVATIYGAAQRFAAAREGAAEPTKSPRPTRGRSKRSTCCRGRATLKA